jgi:hypothetical protein
MFGLFLPTLITSAQHDHFGHFDSIAGIAWHTVGESRIRVRESRIPHHHTTGYYSSSGSARWDTQEPTVRLRSDHSTRTRKDSAALGRDANTSWHATADLALITHL